MEEVATKPPCTIPGYFDPMTINIYFPSPPNELDSKTANFNVYVIITVVAYNLLSFLSTFFMNDVNIRAPLRRGSAVVL